MRVDVVYLPADLRPHHLAGRAVAVFDVLRATTTMTAALAAGVVLVALSACNQKQQAAAPVPGPIPEVNIVTVHEQPIPYVRDLPGRVAPLRIAEVRSRVSGLVVKRTFEQGSLVKEGDVLYKIDPAPFEVELQSAEAALARTEAAQVLGGAKTAADLGRDFGATLTESELRWMIGREWARDAQGVLWRRSKLGLRLTPDEAAAVEDYMASERVAA